MQSYINGDQIVAGGTYTGLNTLRPTAAVGNNGRDVSLSLSAPRGLIEERPFGTALSAPPRYLMFILTA